jgi:diguanylate cyclase (GGDEF)-like protein
MTLSKQLILLVSALVLLLFVGTFFISAANTRDYLESQLASHAQDAATSLGLSATAYMADDDRAMVTAMVDAMIHRGDYLSIRVEDLNGKVWVERKADLRASGVPQWFRRLFPLHPPQGDASMMSGWRQVGTVKVVSHPGLAYRKLWQTSGETLGWFVLGALVVLVAALLVLRLMLRPLKEVEWQAGAICDREFPVVEQRPFTLEFRRVVEAMNRMSTKVSQMLLESERLASRLREQAYQDPVTGLANRRQFMDVLAHRVEDAEAFQHGGLLLLQIRDFKTYNQQFGYPAGDRLLGRFGELLTEHTRDLPKSTPAHLSGADFALLAEDVDPDSLQTLAQGLAEGAAALYTEMDLPSADVAHIGAVVFSGQSVSELLSQADLALRQAQREVPNGVVVQREGREGQTARSASQWRALIEAAVKAGSFHMLRQPVLATADRSLMHREVFLRLVNPQQPEEVIPAGVFMPMAENIGLADLIDRTVLSLVLQQMAAASDDAARIAVNMSPASLQTEDMLDWVCERLTAQPRQAARLVLEWPEYGATAHVHQLQAWIARLAPLGVQFSLDHFGKGFSSFAYLRDLKAHYLKVDGSYLKSLEAEPNNQFFLQALADIARGLEMQVVAESVETESVWQQLAPLGVDGGRGYWLGAPA